MEQDKDLITPKKILQFTDFQNQEVLEIGCGNGRITASLAGKPKRLVAIDPNAENIEEAKLNVANTDFRIGSGESLEFPENSFDTILFTLSLHHQDGRSALKEAGRVLKDKGCILVLEPVNDGEIEQVCNLFHDESQALGEARHAIAASNFEVAFMENFTVCWMFENKTELYEWLFDYYDMQFDSGLVSQVFELLKNKLEIEPIILQDKLMIALLRKQGTPVEKIEKRC